MGSTRPVMIEWSYLETGVSSVRISDRMAARTNQVAALAAEDMGGPPASRVSIDGPIAGPRAFLFLQSACRHGRARAGTCSAGRDLGLTRSSGRSSRLTGRSNPRRCRHPPRRKCWAPPGRCRLRAAPYMTYRASTTVGHPIGKLSSGSGSSFDERVGESPQSPPRSRARSSPSFARCQDESDAAGQLVLPHPPRDCSLPELRLSSSVRSRTDSPVQTAPPQGNVDAPAAAPQSSSDSFSSASASTPRGTGRLGHGRRL